MARPKNCGRCSQPKSRCKCGRPTKMTPETLAKLEQSFAIGCTDIEACALADISKDVLYNYQKKNPKFVERKARLRELLSAKARSNIAKSMRNEDAHTSKWYLERKKKEEFSERAEFTTPPDQPFQIIINRGKQ